MGDHVVYGAEYAAKALDVSVSTLYRIHAAGLLKSNHYSRIRCTEAQIDACRKLMATKAFGEKMRAHRVPRKLRARRGRPAGSAEIRALEKSSL